MEVKKATKPCQTMINRNVSDSIRQVPLASGVAL